MYFLMKALYKYDTPHSTMSGWVSSSHIHNGVTQTSLLPEGWQCQELRRSYRLKITSPSFRPLPATAMILYVCRGSGVTHEVFKVTHGRRDLRHHSHHGSSIGRREPHPRIGSARPGNHRCGVREHVRIP